MYVNFSFFSSSEQTVSQSSSAQASLQSSATQTSSQSSSAIEKYGQDGQHEFKRQLHERRHSIIPQSSELHSSDSSGLSQIKRQRIASFSAGIKPAPLNLLNNNLPYITLDNFEFVCPLRTGGMQIIFNILIDTS